MKEKLYVTIPEPCHEDWNQMTPAEQGRYCGACKKNVVDFASSSDEEIISFFKNYNGTVCGSFSEDQLNRPIEVIELKQSSSFLKYAAGLLLPALFFGGKLQAQKKKVKELQEVVVTGAYSKNKVQCRVPTAGPVAAQIIDTFKVKAFVKPSANVEQLLTGRTAGGVVVLTEQTFHGKVIERSGTSIAFVSVVVNESGRGIVTDEQGLFELTGLADKAMITFSSFGFIKKNISFSDLKSNKGVIVLESVSTGTSEVIVTGILSKRVKHATGFSIVKPKKGFSLVDKLKEKFTSPSVKAFPNPVSSSESLHVLFGNTKAGLYQIRLLSSTGQLFYSFQKQITGKNEAEQIHLNNQMTPGVYILQVIDDQNKLVQSTKIIIQ